MHVKSNGKMQQDQKSDIGLEGIDNSRKTLPAIKRISEKTMEIIQRTSQDGYRK